MTLVCNIKLKVIYFYLLIDEVLYNLKISARSSKKKFEVVCKDNMSG